MLLPCQHEKLARGVQNKKHAMSQKLNAAIAVIGIDIGKNSFHIIGQDQRGAIVLRQKWSRGQVETRLAKLPPCLIGMEACVGAHHLSRKLQMLGHDACVPIRRDRRMTSVMRKPSRGGAAADDHPRLRRRIFTWASLHLRWAFQMLEPFVRYSSPCSPQALQGSASSTSRRACHCLGHQAVPG